MKKSSDRCKNAAMFKGWFSKYPSEILCSVIVCALTCPVSILISKWLTDRSPDVVVRQYYNTVDTKAEVPSQVGELVLDYEMSPSPRPSPSRGEGVTEGVYLLEVANEGDGAEENLSFQVKFVPSFMAKFYKDPDLNVFGPKEMALVDGKFFTELEKFPIGAVTEVSFVPPVNAKDLCGVDIKIAGKTRIGRVEGIRGVKCD